MTLEEAAAVRKRPKAWWSRPTIGLAMLLIALLALGIAGYVRFAPRPLVVDVTRASDFVVDRQTHTTTSLEAYIRRARPSDVTIRANANARYDRVLEAVGAITNAGVRQVRFAQSRQGPGLSGLGSGHGP